MPAHLCTSPIPLAIPGEMEESTEGPSVAVSGARRKKRRRKRIRSDNHAREAGSSSDERDKEWERESEAGLESSPKEQPVGQLQIRLETMGGKKSDICVTSTSSNFNFFFPPC